MAADDYEVSIMAAALASIHGRCQGVRPITLDETPRGVIKMHARADALPSSPVINESVARRAVDYTQDKAAIRASHRLGRRFLSSTHELQPARGVRLGEPDHPSISASRRQEGRPDTRARAA
jgi:hypothetical protein